MDFRTGAELLAICDQEKIGIGEAMLQREMELFSFSRKDALSKMGLSYQIMKEAAQRSVEKPIRSIGGLIGGEGSKLFARRQAAKSPCGDTMARAIAYAMGVLEVNAAMGLIVAAPTAGSCGVIPGSFLAVQEDFELSDEQMTMGLYNTAAVGYLIMRNATVSGAQGGCQAEVGAASAMVASAVAEMLGAQPQACLAAASSALSNILGLVCDPVAGLVEAPCQKRNALGASNGLICAQMALSGVSELIPFDEMVQAMYEVGLRMPVELRETARGGVAATPTGCAACRRVPG